MSRSSGFGMARHIPEDTLPIPICEGSWRFSKTSDKYAMEQHYM
jgi:hypothetical protein